MIRITHRTLRNNSSEILRAVDNGQSYQITNYGRVVALLIPAPSDPLEVLRQSGQVDPPTVSLDAVLSQPLISSPTPTADVLQGLRDDR